MGLLGLCAGRRAARRFDRHRTARCHAHPLDPQVKDRGHKSTSGQQRKGQPTRTAPPPHHHHVQVVALNSSPGLLSSMTDRLAPHGDAWPHLLRLRSRCLRRLWVRQARFRLVAPSQNPSPMAGHVTPCRSKGKTSTAIAHYSRNWHSMPSEQATALAPREEAGASRQARRAASWGTD